MKTRFVSKLRGERGYALLMVLFFAGISLMALSGALQWTSSSARTTDRNNRYFAAVSAAEAATEKVLTKVSRDYLYFGEGEVFNRMGDYAKMVPTSDESAYWNSFVFSDAQGNKGQTYIKRTGAAAYVPLDSQYEGLYGLAANYRIISNAGTVDMNPNLTAAVKQDVQVAAIPIFQFAIFYQMDLEMNPGPNMTVTGRVHSNNNIYLQPQATLTFLDHVTAATKIVLTKSSLDPSSRTPGLIDFEAKHTSGVRQLNLPIGTNNSPMSVRQVVELPPDKEPVNSLMGQQRYYNKADMIIRFTNNTVSVTSGAWNNFASVIPWTSVSNFVSTNATFKNVREGKDVKAIDIDIAKLIEWSKVNTGAGQALPLGRDVNCIYVADSRVLGSAEAGVRLINGETLPSRGLTVASPNPAYIQGNFNSPVADRGTDNTANTKPSSVVADAITVLSTNWKDANSSSGIGSRLAKDTTVNTAILAGITQSNGLFYSGGVENLPRFLEDWGDDTLTYNGSMVVMFPSLQAKAPWGTSGVYNPPTRKWAFDENFLDATKLPPGTPMVLATIRSKWAMIEPGKIE